MNWKDVNGRVVCPCSPPPVVRCTLCGEAQVLAHEVVYDQQGQSVRNHTSGLPPGWLHDFGRIRCPKCASGSVPQVTWTDPILCREDGCLAPCAPGEARCHHHAEAAELELERALRSKASRVGRQGRR